MRSTHYYDVRAWVESIIQSATTFEQIESCCKLIENFRIGHCNVDDKTKHPVRWRRYHDLSELNAILNTKREKLLGKLTA